MDSLRRKLIIEVGIVTASLITITKILDALKQVAFIERYYGLIFALLFLYVPVVVLQRHRRSIDFMDRDVKTYVRTFITFVIVSVIVFPPFFLAAYGWEKVLFGAERPVFVALPGFWKILPFHLLMIALPEEFFFRGYMQSALNRVFPRKWRFLGASMGWGWVITAAVFALSHSLVTYQWWHFAIFFPALLFGYLRERTGSITAPILFHAAANLIMDWIPYLYS